MMDEAGPNAAQVHYWNEVAGPKWVEQHEAIAGQIRPLGLRAMDRAALAPGERALDVGCGLGETTRELARRVGASGAALGVDVSAVMLERAREAAEAAGLAQVSFIQADAQTAELSSCHGAPFDVLYSRFGVMFFADPAAAFANLRRALRSGARLAFVCWRSLEENPWMTVPLAACAQHLPVQSPEAGAPGPFAFSDGARVRVILERAGFARIEVDAVDEVLVVAGGKALDEATEHVMQMGPLGATLRNASPGPELAARVTRSVRDAIAPHHGPRGVELPGAVWIVTAVAP